MANRQEKRAFEAAAVAKINEAIKAGPIDTEKLAEEITNGSAAETQPADATATAELPRVDGVLTIEEAAAELGRCSDEIARLEGLNAQAQLEIEALQTERKHDREVILGFTERRADRIGDPLLDRKVAADEHDEDPSESHAVAAYDAGLKAGLLRAAMICETRWAGQIGNACAASIREVEEAIQ
jgi:hypothetical protein